MTNQRRFPRIDHVSSRQIILLNSQNGTSCNAIMTQNLSARGVKFTSDTPLTMGQAFLIYLNPVLIDSLKIDKQLLIRSGDYYFCHVMWTKPTAHGIEVGAQFIESQKVSPSDIHHFVTLLNSTLQDTSDQLALI